MKTEMYKKIINYLREVPSDRVFLRTQNALYTFGEIIEFCIEFQNDYTELADKNCVIVSSDRQSLAMYLPAVDSICKRVFLQPNDIGGNETEFYKSADIDYIVRLGGARIIAVEKLNFFQSEKKEREYSGGYILATSGTTGTPKLAIYTLNSLTATAKNNISRGHDFIWGLSYDINRFAGLQVYLQAVVAGSTLVISENNESIHSLVQFYASCKVNCLSATPSFWRKMLMVPSSKCIPFKRITLGGEISNQSILNSLSSSYPEANIVHIYASTEAGVGFVVKDKKEGFPSQYLSVDSVLEGEVKVKNGLLWIKNLNRCSNFLKGILEIDDEGFINTGDLVEVKGDRVFFLGRESGSINVGGNKVMPERVESVLEECSLVKMANVFAKKSSLLGAIVCADIVIEEDAEALSWKEVKSELIKFCRGKLELFEIPAILKKVEAIEMNSTGKKIRNHK